jgi:hypothetical protein
MMRLGNRHRFLVTELDARNREVIDWQLLDLPNVLKSVDAILVPS